MPGGRRRSMSEDRAAQTKPIDQPPGLSDKAGMEATRRRIVGLSAAAAAGLAAAPLASAGPPMKKLRILILGGTGFIGPHQVRYALARGHQVTAVQPRAAGQSPGRARSRSCSATATPATSRRWPAAMGRLHRQPHHPALLGARRRQGAGRQGRPVRLHLDDLGLRRRTTSRPTRRDALAPYTGKDPMAETQASARAPTWAASTAPLKAVSEAEARRQFGAAATIVRPGPDRRAGRSRPTASPTGRCAWRAAARCWRPATAATRCSSSTPATWPNGRSALCRAAHVRRLQRHRPGAGADHGRRCWRASARRWAAIRTWSGSRQKFLDANKVSAWSDMPVWVPGNGDTAGFHRRDIRRALRRRPDLPAAGDDRRRHPGLVQDAAGGPPGEAASRPHARPRGGAAGEVEGAGLRARSAGWVTLVDHETSEDDHLLMVAASGGGRALPAAAVEGRMINQLSAAFALAITLVVALGMGAGMGVRHRAARDDHRAGNGDGWLQPAPPPTPCRSRTGSPTTTPRRTPSRGDAVPAREAALRRRVHRQRRRRLLEDAAA